MNVLKAHVLSSGEHALAAQKASVERREENRSCVCRSVGTEKVSRPQVFLALQPASTGQQGLLQRMS